MRSLELNPSLEFLAKKYVWWESPQWACQNPKVFLGNVMNLGSWEDMCKIRELIGNETLRLVLTEDPPVGLFSIRSWDYWHVILEIDPIPPLPKRKFL